MKFFLIVAVCLVSALVASARSPAKRSWQEFKAKYGKEYNSLGEDAIRYKIFRKNLAMIERHNAQPNKTFTMGVNHLTDLTRAEYQKLNGFRKVASEQSNVSRKISYTKNMLALKDGPLPDSVDWSKHPNRVSPVKNQGQCGSCWAFATIGLFEGQENKNSTANRVTELSEQNLVDCDRDGDDLGCQGGTFVGAIEFIHNEGGLETEKDYPYKSGAGEDDFKCKYDKTKSFVTTMYVKRYEELPAGDEKTLKEMVAHYGPVAVAIDASLPSFQMYKGGVYRDGQCSSTNLDHGVLLVGYGTDEEHGDYWLIKNSWSTQWGDEGYIKIARNHKNLCGVASSATVVY